VQSPEGWAHPGVRTPLVITIVILNLLSRELTDLGGITPDQPRGPLEATSIACSCTGGSQGGPAAPLVHVS
jgi:hypothetical protein